MSTTQQPEALNLEEFRAKVTHAAREPLLARIAELEASESRTITQRDHCEEVIDRMADAVLGKDRHEWTSNYDYMDAAQEVEDRIAELEAQLSAIGAGGVEPLRKTSADTSALRAALEEAESALEVATSRLSARGANYPVHVTSEARALEIVRKALGKSQADHFRDATKMMLPTAQVLEPVEQRQLDIGKAIERACQELPEGAEIQIYLERGAGTVHMTDWDGNEFDHFDEDHDDFACRINAATDGAIAAEQVAAEQVAAHVKQGGAAS